MPIVVYEALHETVTYLLNEKLPMNQIDNLVFPNFDNRITFNGLINIVNSQLVIGSYHPVHTVIIEISQSKSANYKLAISIDPKK